MTELNEEYTEDTACEQIAEAEEEYDATPAPEETAEVGYSLDDELDELSAEFPELVSSVKNTNSERYGELRALGLSPREAYLATGEYKKPRDTRGHLGDSVPRAAKSPASKMSRRELEIARSVFEGMSDDEIRRLYNKVNLR